jgi:hypothetical protein
MSGGMEAAFSQPPEPFNEEDSCAYAMAAMLIRIHGRRTGAQALAKLNAMRQRGEERGMAFWFKTAYAVDAMTTSQNVQA